ncbi:Abi family protein [Nocardia puris]|uniref:Abi family protein n=1 Tax=Nocardia puris TaxID=208602 RepID=UPI001475E4DD|nr:Abi family protein [Nocardia puris]
MKPFLSLDQQVQKLRDNGLSLTDAEAVDARRFLQDHNYYRVSGSFRYFQADPVNQQNRFTAEASFAKIRQAHDFDRHLAVRLQAGLAEFEIVFRSQLAYLVAKSTGPDSYLYETTYDGGDSTKKALIKSINDELERSTERFVQHHRRLGQPVPIWAAVEVFSLGTSSKLYGLIADAEGVFKPLAERFGISHRASRKIFRSMSVLRNVCAHHGRIWNRNHGIDVEAPPQVRSGSDKAIFTNTPWAWVLTVGYLTDQVRGDASYSESLWDFIDAQPDWLCEGLTYPSPK